MASTSPVRIGIFGVLLAVSAGIAGWTVGNDALPAKVPPAPPDDWQLPNWHLPTVDKPLQILRSRLPWGPEGPSAEELAAQAAAAAAAAATNATAQAAAAPPAPPAPPPVEWRLAGLVAGSKNSLIIVLVKDPSQPAFVPRFRRVGEPMPDGSVLKEISATGVLVDAGGTVKFIPIFNPKT